MYTTESRKLINSRPATRSYAGYLTQLQNKAARERERQRKQAAGGGTQPGPLRALAYMRESENNSPRMAAEAFTSYYNRRRLLWRQNCRWRQEWTKEISEIIHLALITLLSLFLNFYTVWRNNLRTNFYMLHSWMQLNGTKYLFLLHYCI